MTKFVETDGSVSTTGYLFEGESTKLQHISDTWIGTVEYYDTGSWTVSGDSLNCNTGYEFPDDLYDPPAMPHIWSDPECMISIQNTRPTLDDLTSTSTCEDNVLTATWEDTTGNVTGSGTSTTTWSNEYDDEDLRSDILDHLQEGSGTAAYSDISADHLDGGLSRLIYKFKLPKTDKDTTYKVVWDEVTRHPDGRVIPSRMEEEVEGTGDLVYTSEHTIEPPPFTDHPDGGVVSITPELRSVEIVDDDGSSGSPGAGGPGSGGAGPGGGCAPCAGGASGNGLWAGAGGNSSAGLWASLGKRANGRSAGKIYLAVEEPSSSMFNPKLLRYSQGDTSLEVQVIRVAGVIRQIKAPQAVCLIKTIVPNSWYEIQFFLPAQISPTPDGEGIYQPLPGQSPFAKWLVKNPSLEQTNLLEITEIQDAITRTYLYTYDSVTRSWVLPYPGNLRSDITLRGELPNDERFEEDRIRNAQQADVYRVKRIYKKYSWGEGIISSSVGSSADPHTTTYEYYGNGFSAGFGGQPPVSSVVQPNGSWQSYYYNFELGLTTAIYRGFKDDPVGSSLTYTTYDYSPIAAAGDVLNADSESPYYNMGLREPRTPRTVCDYINGVLVSKRFTVIKDGERIEIRSATGGNWNDPGRLVTTTRYYTAAESIGYPAKLNRVKNVELPDGTMTFYSYGANGFGGETTIIKTGDPNTGKTDIEDGTLTVIETGALGEILSRIVKDVASNPQIILASDTYVYVPGSFNRSYTVTHLDGTTETYTHACCGTGSYQDRDGVVTTYHYDELGRQAASTRLGITTTNLLDAAGNTKKTTRISGTPVILRQATFDQAGHPLTEINALNGTTTYSEEIVGDHQVRTITYPDLGERVETRFRDGSIMSVEGSAAFPVYYDYGADGDGAYTLETKGSASGDEWTKTYTDLLGRAYKTVYADTTPGDELDNSWFNLKGQLAKRLDPDGVATLYKYNDKGELEITAVDLDPSNTTVDAQGNFPIDLSVDRVQKTTKGVYPNALASPIPSVPVRRTQQFVFDTDGNPTPTLVTTHEVSTDGLRTWVTTTENGVTTVTATQTKYGDNDGTPQAGYRTVTVTHPDMTKIVSVYHQGRLKFVAHRSNTTPQTQITRTSYEYDSHGRTWKTTDARISATTTFGYNNADQVNTVTTPRYPASGLLEQTTTTFYDISLRAWKVRHPDNTETFSVFFKNGLLQKTYGSRTYPVEYQYDYAGRMTYMTTWQDYGNPTTTDAVTKWTYDPYRGWLIAKDYPNKVDGTEGTIGTDYQYTQAGRLRKRTWARESSGNRLETSYEYGFDDDDSVVDNQHGDVTKISYANDPNSTPAIAYTYDRRGRQKTITQNSIPPITLTVTYSGTDVIESYTGGTLDNFAIKAGYDNSRRRNRLTVAHNTQDPVVDVGYIYDSGGRLSTVTDNLAPVTPHTVTYGYEANSRLIQTITYKQNSSTTRLATHKWYDSLDRVLSINSSMNGVYNPQFNPQLSYQYAYNTANQRSRMTKVNGSYWDYSYDDLGQLITGKHRWVGGALVAGQQFEYLFDDIGNRTQTKAGGSATGTGLREADYAGNFLNQYESREVPPAIDVLGMAAVGTSVTVEGQQAFRDAAYFWKETPLDNSTDPVWQEINVVSGAIQDNRFAFLPENEEQFTYDEDGNLTQDGRWDYTWDAENRLVQLVKRFPAIDLSKHPHPTTGTPTLFAKITFEYDARGRRIAKRIFATSSDTTPFALERYVYDGWQCVGEFDGHPTAPSLKRAYAWGTDLSGSRAGAGGVGGLLMLRSIVNGMHFYSYDGNGNVVALVNASDGKVSANYEYGPFGELIRVTGPMAENNPFRFATKYQDNESELYYYGYRYLNVSVGRWVNPDPIEEKGGVNLYAFTLNDPANDYDFVGLWTKEGVLAKLCCCRKWVVTDCLSKKTVIAFDEIWVTYDKYEKKANGQKGNYIGKHTYPLAGLNPGDNTIWVEKSRSDGDAAATLFHECLHDKITGPSVIEEEVETRIAEEWYRIELGIPEAEPGYRYKPSLCFTPPMLLIAPDPEAITKWVKENYAHRNPDSPYIFENRKEEIKGKSVVSGWSCPN